MIRNLRARSLILALAWLAPRAAAAQPADGGIPEWVRSDPFAAGEHDPLGIDRGDRLDAVEPTHADEEAHAPIPVTRGEIVTAIPGVREEEHTVDVELRSGLAIVSVEMRFTSSARYAAEVRYRLAVPEGASVARLEVCNARGCRRGLVDESTTPLGPYDEAARRHGSGALLPIAHAAPIDDDRGHALSVRAAPVLREGRPLQTAEALSRTPPGDGPLTVRLTYVVPAPVRGGHVRFAIPARGRDGRAAPARIRVRSEEVSGARVQGNDAVEAAVERAAWEASEITASLEGAPRRTARGWRVPCGSRTCARLRVVASPARPSARDVILLVDASPSTQGPARGRIAPTVAALLASLPSGSRVSVAVFAARAEAVAPRPVAPTEVSLVEVTQALERELGSATRFEAAWELVAPWVSAAHDPTVVLVGDGGLTIGDEAARALSRARTSAEVASVNVADRPSTRGLRDAFAGAMVLDVGAEADRAASGHGMEALAERLAPIFAPVVEPHVRARIGARTLDLGALRAGEELSWEGALDRGRASLAGARVEAAPDDIAIALRDRAERTAGMRERPIALAAVAQELLSVTPTCGTSGAGPGAAVSRDDYLALADARRCDGPATEHVTRAPASAAPPEGRIARLAAREGESRLPSRSLLDMLRQRIVPVARGCFREDRAGRPNYQTRAVFDFRLADREVVEAQVTGRLSPELRACLLHAVDGLAIPRFDGTVEVHYPIYTAPQLPPPTLTLDGDVADAVDEIAPDER